jgi:hypothetical protein
VTPAPLGDVERVTEKLPHFHRKRAQILFAAADPDERPFI